MAWRWDSWLSAIFHPQRSFFMRVHRVMHDLARPFSHMKRLIWRRRRRRRNGVIVRPSYYNMQLPKTV